MDLIIAMSVMATFALVVFAVTSQVISRLTENQPRLASLLLALFVLLSLGLLFGTKDQLEWARWIPVSAAIIYSNVTVLSLAAAAAAAWRLPDRPRWRQYLSAAALLLLAAAALVQPVLQPQFRPTRGGDVWSPGNVCLQTQPATCSSAAGATLLAAHGMDVTESQMVVWSLNDSRGTPSLGLWRGLNIATEGSSLEPRVVTADTEQLLTSGPWPALLVVGLPPGGADPVYQEKYGWAPGFRHSVVLFGVSPDGAVDIGDPSIGRETWSREDLRVLWRGEAIELAP